MPRATMKWSVRGIKEVFTKEVISQLGCEERVGIC